MINITELTNKKSIYRFPENLVDSYVDEGGKPTQFILFEIASPGAATSVPFTDIPIPGTGSAIGGMDAFIVEKETEDNNRVTFADEIDNKPQWRMANKLGVVDVAIALPMPTEHRVATSIGYTQSYQPSDLQKAGDALRTGGVAGIAADKITSALAGGAAGRLSAAGAAISRFSNAMIGGKLDLSITEDQVLATQGMAINPRNEVMFNGLGFRSFDFRYTFAPKNASESALLHGIIRKFRYYSLPELSATKKFFTFPGVFRIQFFWGESPNIWLPKIGTCVLNNITVDYSPNSVWATLPLGDPSQVNITMSFTEIELVDRTRVDNTGIPGANFKESGY